MNYLLLSIVALLPFTKPLITVYQIPLKDSALFYFIYRIPAYLFPDQIDSLNRTFKVIQIYAEIGYKGKSIGALWTKDTLYRARPDDYFNLVYHLLTPRRKKYTIKSVVMTEGNLELVEYEDEAKDLFPISQLIPTSSDTQVKFTYYFDTIGILTVYNADKEYKGILSIKDIYSYKVLELNKFHLKPGWNFIKIRLTSLKTSDTYLFILSLPDIRTKREVKVPVYLKGGLGRREWNLLLSAAKFILTPSELDTLYKVKDDSIRMALWKKFWKKRDPNPATPENEAYNLFLNRLEYALRRFRSGFKNRLSDMAIIYITLGEPSNVQRYTAEGNITYEIWYYQRYNLKIVFMDKWGFGEYEIISPPYYELENILRDIKDSW